MLLNQSVNFIELLKALFIDSKFVPIDFQVSGRSVDIELILTKNHLKIKVPLGHGYWTSTLIDCPTLTSQLKDFIANEYKLDLEHILLERYIKIHVTATTFDNLSIDVIIKDRLPSELTDNITNHKSLIDWTLPEASKHAV